MLQSHVITIGGTFMGVAVRLDRGYRFVAVDPRVHDLDETVWPKLADVERLVRQFCHLGRAAPDIADTPMDGHRQVGG